MANAQFISNNEIIIASHLKCELMPWWQKPSTQIQKLQIYKSRAYSNKWKNICWIETVCIMSYSLYDVVSLH